MLSIQRCKSIGLLTAVLVALGCFTAFGAEANGKGQGKGNGKGNSQEYQNVPPGKANNAPQVIRGSSHSKSPDANVFINALADSFITSPERQKITSYFSRYKMDNGGSLPPGLAKQGKIPPGIAKQLYRNRQIPREVQTDPLPEELIRILPLRTQVYEYRYVDGRILLIEAATNVIVDMLRL